MKTDTTLRITRRQYRQFAELAKSNGVGLTLDTFTNMGGIWGEYSSWAQPVIRDVSSESRLCDERTAIKLAASVNAGAFRNAHRPELDWAVLEDGEIFQFIVNHEIGHHIDNFSICDLSLTPNREVEDECFKVMRRVNEMLADRYAWEQVRPGEPLPLSEAGKRLQEVMAADLELLNKNMPRTRRAPKALPSGQYTYVPASMLKTEELAAFVGPHVSPALIEHTRNRRRIHRRDSRLRA
ncbi:MULTISPECIES: hypothetical protein [Pseudomonas]|uniref:hypothetical protein n=1 Tax=Pseudomonas TaxID=286 RepID=UPI0025A961AE|nr:MULTISPECIES: hypothetical protein [Pseudomonas]MDM9596956.1 hypothetical protein [Pseudomonas shirazica]MDO2416359.1 hypothetical protein [Pseudomonas shirazica]MDS9588924.1 hypothetical protein [Pseudomonas sp. HTZ1]